jgi:hypothetical protein
MKMKTKFLAVTSLLAVGLTLSGCAGFNINKGDNPDTGIKSTDGFVFTDLTDITTMPQFGDLPKEINGWKQGEVLSGEFSSVDYENENGCTFIATIGSAYSVNESQGDYFSTKSSFYNIPQHNGGGTPVDESILEVKSDRGNIDFVSGTYNPTTYFDADKAMEESFGIVPLEGDYTTFFAIRMIDSIPNELTDVESSEGTSSNLSASMLIDYTCETAEYDEKDALNMIAQLSIETKEAK